MNRVKTGILWSFLERFSVQGAQFLINLILARLLMPSDYGLVAMTTVFISIGQVLVDSGFSNALIHKRNRSENDYTTVFAFSVFSSIVIYLILFFASPAIASFYSNEELINIVRATAVIIPLSSFFVVQRAILTIGMNFKAQAMISLLAVIISGTISIYLAYYQNVGVWALVCQTTLSNFLIAILTWAITGWFPRGKISKQSFSELFGFGSKLLMTGVLNSIYSNLYFLVIGKKFSASELGFYNRGFSFAYIISETITTIIHRVAYPIQCENQDDAKKLSSIFAWNLRGALMFLLPFMICLISFADPMVLVLLGEKWATSAKFVVVLSIAHLFRPLISVNETVLTAKGRTDLFLRLEVYSKVIALIILFATVPFGVYVMCLGMIAANFINYFLSVFFARRVVDTSFPRQMTEISPVIGVGLMLWVINFISLSFFKLSVTQLFAGSFICFVSYGLCLYLFKFREVKLFFSKVR